MCRGAPTSRGPEVGEAFRPLVPVEAVYLSYVAAISYILAATSDAQTLAGPQIRILERILPLENPVEFDAFLRGSNKVTKTGKIMQFESVQIQPGNVRQTKLYEYNSELSRLEYVKGIECKNCEGGVKIAFDRLNEKSDLYHYWCIGRP